MKPCRKKPRPAAGFTLLELLVVSVLMLVVTMGTAQLGRHFSLQTANIEERATASRELKFALEYVRRDMGPLLWATPVGLDQLVLGTETPEGEEAIVDYSVEDGRLLRHDQSTGQVVPVAGGVSQLLVEDVGGAVLRVTVTVSAGEVNRRAILLWSRP